MYSSYANATQMLGYVSPMLVNATAIQVGPSMTFQGGSWPSSYTIQCTTKGTGAVYATIAIQGSDDYINWFNLATLPVSNSNSCALSTTDGTNPCTNSTSGNGHWLTFRAYQTAVTAGDSTSCTMVY